MADTSYLELLSYGDQGWGDEIARGAWVTIQISASSYLVGMGLGLVGAAAKLSGRRWARWLADLYTTIVRAVPELLLIIFIYYTGTSTLAHLLGTIGLASEIQVSPFAAAVAALGFIMGAYMTEVFRGAILSVPKGQMEAACAFGMHTGLRFRRILFPQMMRYALPGLGNLWVIVLKDSSLISVVGFYELLFTVKQAAASTRMYFFFYTVGPLVFLAFNILSNLAKRPLEHHVSRGVRVA